MGIFSCCFLAEQYECNDSGKASERKLNCELVQVPNHAASLDVGPARSVPEAGTQVPACRILETNECVKETRKEKHVCAQPMPEHWRSGLDCALALQATLCRTSLHSETRAGSLVAIVLKHLCASTVRLYVLGSTQSGSGANEGLDGPLVQLAAATPILGADADAAAPCVASAAAAGGCGVGATAMNVGTIGPSPARRDVYLCPKHEALGASSMLLRRALVSKVSVVHRCEPKPSHHHDHHACRVVISSVGGKSSEPRGDPKVPSAEAAGAAGGAISGPEVSGSSVYSSCTQPEMESLRPASAHCCPDLDLCDADAVPESAMLFAAVPLLFGSTVLGALWIALPDDRAADASAVAAASAAPTASAVVTARSGGGVGAAGAAIASSGIASHPGPLDSATDSFAGAADRLSSPTPAAACFPCPETVPPPSPPPPSPAAVGPAGLLGCSAAMELLSTSVSMSLAAGSADPAHLRRLASWLYRLASGSTLAELVSDVCGMLVRHVRRRFLVDATAHAALVPSADSRVAFMLRPERVEGWPASSRTTRQAHQLSLLTPSRLRMSSIPSAPSVANVMSIAMERSRSVTLAQANASKRLKASMAELQRGYSTASTVPAGSAAAIAIAAAAGATVGPEGTSPAGRPWSLTTLRSNVPREVFMLDSSVPRSEASFGLMSSNCAAPQAPSLSARAFRLSNTLLQALIAAPTQQLQQPQSTSQECGVGGGAGKGTAAKPAGTESEEEAAAAGVLPGIVVRDCARHVQDERQPSRDVCMLMMAPAAAAVASAAAAVGGDGGGRNGGGIMCTLGGLPGASRVLSAAPESGAVPQSNAGGSGSGGGVHSLVLLGMETGDGSVLAVYLCFPSAAPQQLLEAVRDNCNMVLREMLARLVRHRLRCVDLAAEWETLRAGVPGAYLSISRNSAVGTLLDPCAAAGISTGSMYGAQPSLSPSTLGGGGGGGAVQPSLASGQNCPSTTDDGGMLAISGVNTTNTTNTTARGMDSPQHKSRAGSSAAPFLSTSGPVPTGAATPGSGTAAGSASEAGAGGTGAAAASRVSKNTPGRELSSQTAGVAAVVGRQSASQFGLFNGHMAALGGCRLRKGSMTFTTATGMDEGGGMPTWLMRSRRSATTPGPGAAPALPRAASARGMFGRLGRGAEREARGSLVGGGIMDSDGFGITARDLAVGTLHPPDGCAPEEDECWLQELNTGPPATMPGVGVVPAVAAGLLTVHDLDETYESWGMRAHMGALVDSILSTTLRSSGAHCRVDDGGHHGSETAAARITEGLDELQLSAVLGQGASGVVLKGTLGCAPVAVKIMEMPDADASVRDGGALELQLAQSGDEEEDGSGGGGGGVKLDAEQRAVRARRALLRNAMEVALMRSISHVNIVQAFGVYDNVIMERHEGRQGIISLRRVNTAKEVNNARSHEEGAMPGVPKSSPICTAIVMELCDRGSLADVLHSRTFPALPLPPPHPSSSPAATAGVAMQYARYWRGIYMTLLEIALALRHLHSRRLVHRDLKPGNVLLKSSPGDPRGWTCKLADFGFALVLDRVDVPSQDGSVPWQTGGGGASSSSSVALAAFSSPPVLAPVTSTCRDWYTIQQHVGGTVTHMAPEAFRKGSTIDASVDIFSFGIIMWEMCCGRGHRPYKELDLDAISAAVTSGARPLFPPGDHVPLSYRQLARSCWSQEPRVRPSAGELVVALKGLLESTKA